MTGKAPVFEKIITDYLLQVSLIEEREEVGKSLGITVMDDGYKIQFFNQTYTVKADNIVDADGKTASHVVSVILCKYLLLCSNRPTHDFSLVTYKDFRDAAPYVGGFRNTAEQPISRYFEGALPKLEKRCLNLGGHSFDTEVSCQLPIKFPALPNVPILLLFNDADKDFSAHTTLLFQRNAASYLDMECLAMIGATLAHRLQENRHLISLS